MKVVLVKLLVVAGLIVLAGCVSDGGGYQEDARLDEPRGPGIFTGDKGEFSVSSLFDDEKKKLASGGYYILDLDGAPPMSEEQFKEFESFRAWLKSREAGSEEYKEYESWRAFQEFKKLESQKNTQ